MTDERPTAEEITKAIQVEREARDYQVVVAPAEQTRYCLGVSVPLPLRGMVYMAQTTCTVEHEHGIPCRWIDYAFLVGGKIRVMLDHDFARVNTLLSESVKTILSEIAQELNH